MEFGISINDLRANAIIGILPFEREKAQEIAVDLEAVYEVDCHDLPKASLAMTSGDDLCESPRNDDITHPLTPSAREGESIVDYALLREIILDSFKQNEFFYLESALAAIQRTILKRFPQILELDLSVKKLEIFSDCVPKVRLSWQKGEKLQGLDCHDLPKASLAMTSEGDSCESPRNDGNGNTK